MAELIVDLGTCKLEGIGVLIETEDGNFTVGKDLENSGGPYR